MINKTISAQWGSFLEYAVENLEEARKVYSLNKNGSSRYKSGRRKQIAVGENIRASTSLLLIMISLESIINSHAFWKKKRKFNQWKPLSDKFSFVVGMNGPKDIIESLNELSIPRDSITHAHLWIKSYRLKNNEEIRAYFWKHFKKNQRTKYKKYVNFNDRRTKKFKFSIIPTDVNFLDAVMGLVIVVKCLRLLGYSDEITIRQGVNFMRKEADKWVDYFKRELEVKYDSKIFKNLQQLI